ncbi:major facilitator superfamily domain-containing protein [Ilyonectria destructans]|nr:major facilitator superfamily domain-containing protein [Ilyonectria destructans]
MERPSSPQAEIGESQKFDARQTDEAATYLNNAEHYEPLSPEEEKKFKRKMDWILLPMLFLVATLGAIDKVALGTSALYGLREDNALVGQQYSWLGSILSLGALFGMFPSSWLIHRFPSAKYLSACSVGWSACSLFLAACHNFAGLASLRFLMGMFEAIIVPGISLILAGFYLKSEQPPRNALVFAAASSVFNGFLSWAIGHIPDSAPLAIWQYLFLLTGSVSMIWSIIAFIWLPSTPMDAFFLSDREKQHAVHRLAANKTGIVNHTWKWSQAKEAVLDPKTWLLFFFNIAINIPNGGLITFGGLIIAGLGYSGVEASLLTMPNGVVSTIAAFVFSLLSAKWHNRRCLVTMLACTVPIIGTAVVYALPRSNIGGQMVGLYFLYTYFGPYVVGIGLAQANTAGHTKKTIVFAILYIGYAVGNLIGPQTFRANQAPAYVGGTISMIVCYCVCIGIMGAYWAFTAWENKKRAAASVSTSQNPDAVESFMDETDYEQTGFMYTT